MSSADMQLHRQHYAYGAISPVLSGVNMMPPFQLVVDDEVDLSALSFVNLSTEVSTNVFSGAVSAGLTRVQFSGSDPYTVVAFSGLSPIPGALFSVGDYYAQLTLSDGSIYYSEVFRMCADVDLLTKITYCHAENMLVPDGRIIYESPLQGFQMFVYLHTTIGKPEYVYENQVETRDGKNFPVRQIRYKRFRFEAIWPEHILDAFSLAPLHDFVEIIDKGTTYEVDEIDIEVNWQEQGNLAAVTIEFRTDTVVVVNARGLTSAASCGVDPGGCFDIDFLAVAYIVEDSAEYLGEYYARESDGVSVPFKSLNYVLIEDAMTGQVSLFQYVSGSYNAVTTVVGQYVYDQNTGTYWYDNGPLITNEITNVTLAPSIVGTAVPPGVVSFYGQRGDTSEFLLGIMDAATFTGSSFPFTPPLCLKGVRMEVANGVCGTYFSGDLYALGPFSVHNAPLDFKNPAAAVAGGVQPGRLYALTADNTLGLPEGIVMQLPPYDGGGFVSINAGKAAVGLGCMFALAENNIHGAPGGTLCIAQNAFGVPAIYDDDVDAAAGGIVLNRIYAFNALSLGFPGQLIKKRLS